MKKPIDKKHELYAVMCPREECGCHMPSVTNHGGGIEVMAIFPTKDLAELFAEKTDVDASFVQAVTLRIAPSQK